MHLYLKLMTSLHIILGLQYNANDTSCNFGKICGAFVLGQSNLSGTKLLGPPEWRLLHVRQTARTVYSRIFGWPAGYSGCFDLHKTLHTAPTRSAHHKNMGLYSGNLPQLPAMALVTFTSQIFEVFRLAQNLANWAFSMR